MSSGFLLFIVAAGIIQGVFLAGVVYFNPAGDRKINRFLALYIATFCIPMSTPLVQYFFPWQYLILLDPFTLLTGPMLYFYIRSFKEDLLPATVWLHLIIFFIYIILDVMLYVDFREVYPPSHSVPPEVVRHPTSVLRVSGRLLQLLLYFYLAIVELRNYQSAIKHLYSEISRINLQWIWWLIFSYMFLVLLMMVLYLLILRYPQNFSLFILINTAVVTPYFYLVTYKCIRQPSLWRAEGVERFVIQKELKDTQCAIHELDRSRLTVNEDLRMEDINAIVTLMECDRLFLKPDLSLNDLSLHLHKPSYIVSQLLNDGLHKTFYDLVNGYRVEEAKRLLTEDSSRKMKMIAIASDSGFNSKTTFNTVFKKITGLTPSEFRDSLPAKVIPS